MPPRNSMVLEIECEREMSKAEYEAAVTKFIRTNGISRCPTVSLAPTQGSVAAADRMALERRAEQFEEVRRARIHDA